MNLSKLTKVNIISELEKRSLPTNGLKDELLKRLKEAIEKESVSENDNQEENYDSEDENVEEEATEDKFCSNQESDSSDKLDETFNDAENVKEINAATELTVDDAINMKSAADVENYSMIVNVNDDDNSQTNSINDRTVDFEQTSGNRDIDNGEHEVIEISEEVIIDDEDNQENDTNYNEEQSNNDQIQQDKDELESGESREEEPNVVKEKITLWVHNVDEDVKALELKELFGKYGKVTSAKVVMNGKDATGNCFGCIELSNNDDAESCIKNLDKTEFRGNTITVSKNICDLPPKETIQRNISPISSTDSWGGDGKNKSKSKSLSPFVSLPSIEPDKDDNKQDDDNKSKAPYRGRGGYRGNNYVPRDYGRNDDSRGRGGYDNRRGNDSRGGYGSRPDRYGDDGARRGYRGGDNDSGRSRDNFPRRGGRDEYVSRGGRDDNGSRGGDSKYQPVNRDKYAPRDSGYVDRSSRSDRYPGDDSRTSRYGGGGYDDHHHSTHKQAPQDYERRGDRRPYHQERPRDTDYVSSSRREPEPPFKRPRPDADSDSYYAQKSRRREYSPPMDRGAVGGGGAPNNRDRYRVPSPKRSYYDYSERDSYQGAQRRRSDSRDKRDVGGHYHHSSAATDRRPPARDYQAPGRKAPGDYGAARPSSGSRGPYSPPRISTSTMAATSGSSRSHYSKDSYPVTDFGGRSRNYDR